LIGKHKKMGLATKLADSLKNKSLKAINKLR
jgi:hypothetical protein